MNKKRPRRFKTLSLLREIHTLLQDFSVEEIQLLVRKEKAKQRTIKTAAERKADDRRIEAITQKLEDSIWNL